MTDYENPPTYASDEIWAGEEYKTLRYCEYVTLTTYEELFEAYLELKQSQENKINGKT